MSAQLVQLENVGFSYGNGNGNQSDELILEDISLSVGNGEIVCIVGASGCGKTTLLNIIAGLLKHNSGNRLVSERLDNKRNKIGYIFQQDALLPWRTVKGNLMLPVEISGENITSVNFQEKVLGHLRDFHLEESVLTKFPAQLSGGMRQRVAIIQALMAEPSLLLLDEPFSALDFYTKMAIEEDFWELIQNSERGAVLVTHDIEQAIALGTRVLIMGGSPSQIVHKHSIDQAINEGKGPQGARGSAAFGNYFSKIWNEMKILMVEP
jgi:NitT/TauT family transport system ATP-binding protein